MSLDRGAGLTEKMSAMLNGRILLPVGAGLYLLLHYVVVCWLTFHLLGGVGALSAELVSVGPVTIRLWWLVAALIIAVAFGAHVTAMTEVRKDDVAVIGWIGGALAHLPAVFGAWGLVWAGPFGHGAEKFGQVVAALLWSVLF